MRKKPGISSKSGSALIGVLIAAAVLGVLVASMTSLFEQANQSQNGIAFRQQTDWLHGEIRGLLSNPQACLNNFNGVLIDSNTNINPIVLRDGGLPAPGAVKYDLLTDYGDRNVRIVSFNLRTLPNPNWYTAGSNQAAAMLTIVYRPIKQAIGSQRLVRSIEISISKSTTGSAPGTVTACAGGTSAGSSQWVTNGTAIHYPLGKVGIGTANPISILHLRSNGSESSQVTALGIENLAAGGGRWAMGVGNTASTFPGHFLIVDYNNAPVSPRVMIDGLGNVGIGMRPQFTAKLIVNGRSYVSGDFAAKENSLFEKDLQVAGELDIGIVMPTCADNDGDCNVNCPGSTSVISGGCRCSGDQIRASFPPNNNGWRCNCVNAVQVTGWAICGRIR